ncbi:MAG: oxidoreductase [Planctomycetes bacterium]|nr:oxidoreductase [Planctomycetota bacterium]
MTPLTLLALAGPLGLFATLSVLSLLGRPASERATGTLVPLALCGAWIASLGMAALSVASAGRRLDLPLGTIVVSAGNDFEFRLWVDGFSVAYLVLILMLCGVTGLFAHRYLHLEPGYNRFFVLFSLFVVGMEFSALAGSMETLIAAWEVVGLSSVMLVGFFHDRPEPIRNAVRVWTIYRIADLGLIFAALLVHHAAGTGSFAAVFDPSTGLGRDVLGAVGLLLLLSAMGKSALLPFSSWLPRAMEGPTPSSAIFYGALSVHLGAFLLLRAGAILDAVPWLAWLVATLGAATALHGAFVARVQTDIKCALAYASLTQVGIIVAEIGLGLRWIPMAHLLGHACLRTLQFLRAPSLLHDLHQTENAIGSHLPRTGIRWERWLPAGLQTRLYLAALERGGLEAILRDGVARPFLAAARSFDRMERWWISVLGGKGA